jgi:hypothetical protein
MDQAECRDTAEDFQKRHERRAEALRTYHDKLSVLIRSHPSQRSNKVKDARWGLALLNKNPLFDNEDAEYKFVQKFRRGFWQPLCVFFEDHDQETRNMLVAFAEQYGAFDY